MVSLKEDRGFITFKQVVWETARQWSQSSISSVNVEAADAVGGLSSTLLVFWPLDPQWLQMTESTEELTIYRPLSDRCP
jgi:hypothetical protein